jgi:hypothetical protein
MAFHEGDSGEKGLRQTPSFLEVGAAGALRFERNTFLPADETEEIELVTFTLKREDFLLYQRTLMRTANLSPGRYQTIAHDQSFADVSGDDWRQFIENQGRTLNILQMKANEVLFGQLPSKPEGWFEFEEAETEITMVRGAARNLAIGLYAAFEALNAEAPNLKSHPEQEVEAARTATALLKGMVQILGQTYE